MDDVNDGPQLEQLACDMRRRAVAYRGEMQAARLCLRHGDEVPHAFEGSTGVGGDELRHADDEAHGGEIVLDVEVELVEQRTDGVRGEGEEEGIAVGDGFRGRLGAERAARATAVLDHHLVSERFRQRLLQDARDDVGAAARRIRHDEAHGLDRPLLAPGADGYEQAEGKHDRLIHCISPMPCRRRAARTPRSARTARGHIRSRPWRRSCAPLRCRRGAPMPRCRRSSDSAGARQRSRCMI